MLVVVQSDNVDHSGSLSSAGAFQARRVPSQVPGWKMQDVGTSATGNHNIQKVNKWIWDDLG